MQPSKQENQGNIQDKKVKVLKHLNYTGLWADGMEGCKLMEVVAILLHSGFKNLMRIWV